MGKVLITGITGFLGSHIAAELLANNIAVIGLKRFGANIWRCEDFKDKITWIDIDADGEYKNYLASISFDAVIHCAWIGVESEERESWNEQSKNIQFLIELLSIAKSAGIKRFLFLGSQAEYGNISGKISEDEPAVALNAYGSIKLACLEILRTFCSCNDINWVWLRLFSVFGEKENDNWLIPSLVKTMLNAGQKDVTAGEQKYAYIYVKDFAGIIYKILRSEIADGIYNVSSNEVRSIRSLMENIRDQVNPSFSLNFGALDYRNNQSMHMEGDISKLTKNIGEIEFTDFSVALKDTLNYYIKK